jgi:hypothetical protein
MRVGSITETVGDFEEVRRRWKLPYPKKGDILTVSAIVEHPNKDVRKKGIVLLYFEELPSLIGVCNKQVNNKPNFVELLLPDSIQEIIKSPLEQGRSI